MCTSGDVCPQFHMEKVRHEASSASDSSWSASDEDSDSSDEYVHDDGSSRASELARLALAAQNARQLTSNGTVMWPRDLFVCNGVSIQVILQSYKWETGKRTRKESGRSSCKRWATQ
jgi:hypothetical protein